MVSVKRILFSLLIIGLIYGFTEVGLRLVGFKPWSYALVDKKEPSWHEPDDVLGWKLKPGQYIYPHYSDSNSNITATIGTDGCRISSEQGHTNDSRQVVALLGCSFTFGHAINDKDTFAWQLQRMNPTWRVLNMGVGGYGTYQSLLRFRQLLHSGIKPSVVLYSFMDQHPDRNVAHPGWMKLLSTFSRRGHVDVPYCTINNKGIIIEHKPRRFPVIVGREHSAVLNLLPTVWERLSGGLSRMRMKHYVTEKLILEMRDMCERNDITFITAILHTHPDTRKYYSEFLMTNGITVVDGRPPDSGDFTVKGEGHPNAEMNLIWAERMNKIISNILISTSLLEADKPLSVK